MHTLRKLDVCIDGIYPEGVHSLELGLDHMVLSEYCSLCSEKNLQRYFLFLGAGI